MRTCVLAIAAEFEKPYWREWAKWHHDIGFDDIWIVTNNWELDGSIPDYVKTYRRDGETMQLSVYNEWMEHEAKNYDWAFVCDLDEFLYMPFNMKDWLLEQTKVCHSIGIPWIHFGDGGPDTPTSGSVIERFTKCEGVYNRHVKTFVNLRTLAANRVLFVNPHFACVALRGKLAWVPWMDIFGNPMTGPYNNFEGKPLDSSKPFLAHYYVKTLDEWRKRRGPQHMRADCRQFVSEDWFYRENHNEVECDLLKDFRT